MGKSKNQIQSTGRDQQIARSAKEMRAACERFCSNQKLALPDLKWMTACFGEREQNLYDEWIENTKAKYGKAFIVIANILLMPTKEHKFLCGYEAEINVAMMFAYEYVLKNICNHYRDYEEELVAASLNSNPRYIREYGETRTTNEYKNFIKDGESIWYPSYYPPLIQNYLFGLKEAEGLPVTQHSLRTILGRALLREDAIRKKLHSCTILIFMSTIEYLCEEFVLETEAELITDTSLSQAPYFNAMPAIDKDIIKRWKTNSSESYIRLMNDFINLNAPDLYEIYSSDFAISSDPLDFLVLTLAAEVSGLPVSSFFHFILLRIMDCLIYRDPTLLKGNRDFSLVQRDGSSNKDSDAIILDAHTKEALGTFRPGNTEHIMGRTLYLGAVITGAVQTSVAAYCKALMKREELESAAKRQAQEQNETLSRQAKQAEREMLAAKRELREANGRIAALEGQQSTKDAYITDLEIELEKYAALEPKEQEEKQEPISYPVRIKKGFKVMIYGGHPSWAKQIAQRFPDILIRRGQYAKSTDGIRNQNLLLFQLNAISHKESEPALAEAKRYGVETVTFQKAGWDTCSRQLYKLLVERDAIAR